VLFGNVELPVAVTYAAIALAAVAATIVHAGIGLYAIAYEHSKGKAQAVGYLFAFGYAEMLALMTDPEDRPLGIGPLLDLDWESYFNSVATSYFEYISMPDNQGLPASNVAASELKKCGRAAAAQDCVQFVQENGSEQGWDILRAYFIKKAGATVAQRKQVFLNELNRQVGQEGNIRIEFPSKPPPRHPTELPDPPDISNL
jgi:hypothetical protein